MKPGTRIGPAELAHRARNAAIEKAHAPERRRAILHQLARSCGWTNEGRMRAAILHLCNAGTS
jgi:hypothetical protein